MTQEPPGAAPRRQRLYDALLGYVEAAEAGAAPDRQAFLAAHPDLAAEIAAFLTDYDRLQRVGAGLRQGDAPWPGPAPVRPPPLAAGGPRPAAAAEAPADAATGALGQLGDYRLIREIGRGGMGIVYEAEQISLRRRVALKVLPFAAGVDERQLRRFRTEAEAAAHMHHSHIVPVFAVGTERGVHYYAMQLIEGQSLATFITELQKLRHPEKSNGSPERQGTGTADAAPAHQEAITVRPRAALREAVLTTPAAAVLTTVHSARGQRFYHMVAGIAKQAAEALEYAH